MKTILVTGSSGFIGYHLIKRLLEENKYNVIGIDNMNDYYDVNLKINRLNELKKYDNYIFYNIDIENMESINEVFKDSKIDIVVNLAARAGVRTSNIQKKKYIDTNIIGFYNMLELSCIHNIEHFIFASSSSVYGDNTNTPYKEEDNTNNQLSIYAATKKCDEIISYAYSKLNNINITGLRFFTVYGPYGRPDMAYFSFTNKLINKEKIDVYNNGNLKRDFTYIDDIIEGIIRVINNTPKEKYNIYNLGNEHPYNLIDFINILVNELIKQNLLSNDFNLDDHIEYKCMQKGDVYETYSDTSKFYTDFNFKPNTSLEYGLNNFVKWYKEYYK